MGYSCFSRLYLQEQELSRYKTFVTQEMLKKGYLAGTSMYTCIAHTPEIIDGYFYELDKVFAQIREFEDGRDVMKALEGPVCQSGFKRLN